MIRLSPNSYRAFLRGYESANRYWEAPDGKRYWRSFYEIDRWDANDDHGLRRVDAGAKKVTDWDGPRHAPNGEGYYVQATNGRWYPSTKFFAEGHKACLGCGHPPPDVRAVVGADNYRVVDPSSADGAM